MQREEMERIFCWKIGAELKGFQYCMMQKSKEEIFASAYQIVVWYGYMNYWQR